MIRTTSAFLPGVEAADRGVHAERAGAASGGPLDDLLGAQVQWVMVSRLACASRCSRERSAPSVLRIAEKRSPLHHTLVSIDSDTGMSWWRNCQVGG